MKLFIIFVLILLYFIAGSFLAGLFGFRINDDDSTFVFSLLWPVFLLFAIGLLIHKYCVRIGNYFWDLLSDIKAK